VTGRTFAVGSGSRDPDPNPVRVAVILRPNRCAARCIQDYLGHRDPKHTVHYTRTAGHRFEGLWR
jgi:hypothetical protein